MIRKIKNFRETGASGQLFIPRAVGALRLEQTLDPLMQAAAGGIASSHQTKNGPRGLGRSAGRRRECAVVIAGTALAPSSISVLNRPQPLTRAQNVRLAVALTRRAQTP